MKKIKWLIFVLTLLMFVLFAYLVTNNKTLFFDNFVYSIVTINKVDLVQKDSLLKLVADIENVAPSLFNQIF